MKLIHPKSKLEAHPLCLIFPPMDDVEFKDLCEDIAGSHLREDIMLLDGKVLDGQHRLKACMETGTKPTFVTYNVEIDGPSPLEYVISKNFKRRHLSASQKAAVSVASLPFFEEEAKGRQKGTQFAPGKAPAPAAEPEGFDSTAKPEPAKPNAATSAPGGASPGAATQPTQPTPPPAPVEAPKAVVKGKASEAVAKVFGVSATMVRLAKKIQKADPDLFQDVLSGKTTVNAAVEIVDLREAEKQDSANKALAKEQWEQSITAIGDKYGTESEVFKAAKAKKILKKAGDAAKFAGMTVKSTKAIIPLLGMGWDMDKATRYLDGKITLENTIEDACNTALAKGKPKDEPYAIVVGEWILTLSLAK